MIRVCEFKMDGYEEPFKLASMTSAEAENHVNEGKELLKREAAGELTPEDWNTRARTTVANALNRAAQNGNSWTPEEIHEQLDIPTINALFLKTLEFSGLKAGEVTAVSASPKSTAA